MIALALEAIGSLAAQPWPKFLKLWLDGPLAIPSALDYQCRRTEKRHFCNLSLQNLWQPQILKSQLYPAGAAGSH
jgi:hypothetical protein